MGSRGYEHARSRLAQHYAAKSADGLGDPTRSLCRVASGVLVHGGRGGRCALNAKLPRFWTSEDDGLAQSWRRERVFCNPPFGRSIGRWTEKACIEQVRGCPLSVLLVPARTDTQWWHETVQGAAEIRFLRGRIKFIHPDDGALNPAPFPCALLIYDGTR